MKCLAWWLGIALLSLTSSCSASVIPDCDSPVPELEDADAYIRRGQRCFNWGYWVKAREYFDYAIQRQPEDFVGHYLRASVFMLQNGVDDHYEKAIADYYQVIRLSPEHTSAHVNLGQAHHMLGQYDQAIYHYTQALQQNPVEIAVNAVGPETGTLGQVGIDARDCSQALTCGRAISLIPEAMVYYLRGNTHRLSEQAERAISDYTQAIQIEPSFYFAYYNRGRSHQMGGDFDAAIADYDQTLEINPSFAAAYYHRGVAYQAIGNVDVAIQDLENFLDSSWNPFTPDAEERLQELRRD